MNKDWPTQQQDMNAAVSIVNEYVKRNEGEPLGFLEVVMFKDEDKKMELKMPQWIVELQSFFRHQYGYEHGHAITSKVLTKFLLKNETLH